MTSPAPLLICITLHSESKEGKGGMKQNITREDNRIYVILSNVHNLILLKEINSSCFIQSVQTILVRCVHCWSMTENGLVQDRQRDRERYR